MVVKLVFYWMLILFLLSCNKREFSQYELKLLHLAGDNNRELKSLIVALKNEKDTNKRKIYERFLIEMPNQYWVRYKLTKKYADGRVHTFLPGVINEDSVQQLITAGYRLSGDTSWDIKQIKFSQVVDRINSVYNYWKVYKKGDLASLKITLEYALPYRFQNEVFCFNCQGEFLNSRYKIADMARGEDTIRGVIKLLNKIFNKYPFSGKYYNFFSSLSFDVIDSLSSCQTWEGFYGYQASVFRSFGVPVKVLYAPYVSSTGKPVYVFLKGNDILKDQTRNLSFEKIAKIYELTSSKKMWSNSYVNLKQLGVAEQDIPVSLFTPKMKDVTLDRALVSNLSIKLPREFENKIYFYLCCYINGRWSAVDYSVANAANKSILFKNIGKGIKYKIGVFENGKYKYLPYVYIINRQNVLDTISGP